MIRFLSALVLALSFGTVTMAQDATTETPIEITEMVEGNPDAKVEVIEYASFTCGHCRNFHADQYQKLKENYIEPGKIRFVLREVYFDRPGLWASMLARCGGEMRFFGLSEMLFEKQQDWLGDGEGAGIAQRLATLGKTAGLTDDQVEACMGDATKAKALVDWFTANVAADEVSGTPTLIINGEKHSNMSYDELSKVLDEALAE